MATDYANDDYIWATHWLSLKRALAGNGIVSGMDATEQAVPSMNVDIAAGIYYSNGTRVAYAGGTIAITAADATYDRWDIITGGPAGLTYTAGVAAPIQVVPNLPSTNDILIAMVKVTAGLAAVLNGNIFDYGFRNIIYEHQSRHLPGGSDALATGVASSIGVANAEGSAAAFARQDHVHAIPALGITTGLIDNLAVTAAKIANLTITSAQIANGTITDTQVATGNKDGTAATPSMRTIGTGALQACAGNDSRLSDTRTPIAHAVNASTYGYGDGTLAGHLRVGTGLGVSAGTVSLGSHAVNASTYGYGDATNAGHVRIGSGLSVATGTVSLAEHGHAYHTNRTRRINLDISSKTGFTSFILNGQTYYGIPYPNGTTTYYVFTITKPADYVSNGIVTLIFGSATAGTGNVYFAFVTQDLVHEAISAETVQYAALYMSDAETYPIQTSMGSAGSYAWTGDFLSVRLIRYGSHASDTYTQTIWLLAAYLDYTADM